MFLLIGMGACKKDNAPKYNYKIKLSHDYGEEVIILNEKEYERISKYIPLDVGSELFICGNMLWLNANKEGKCIMLNDLQSLFVKFKCSDFLNNLKVENGDIKVISIYSCDKIKT